MTVRTHSITIPIKATAADDATARWIVLALLAIAQSAMLALHADTVRDAVSIWNSSSMYQIGWVVVPTLAYLLWHHRRRLSELPLTGSGLGVLAAAGCAFLWAVGELANIAEVRQFGLIAGICATVLAALGWVSFRVVAPFLALLVFLIPTGSFLLTPLKYLTIGFCKVFAFLTGIPFANEGFRIYVDAQRYVVVDDCAGLDYLLMGLFLGLTLGLLAYRRWWKIAALTAFGGLLAIFANGVRVSGIIAYDYVTGSELDLVGHSYFELPALAASFAILFAVFYALPRERDDSTGVGHLAADRHTVYAPILPTLLAAAVMAVPPLLLGGTGMIERESSRLELPGNALAWTQQSYGGDWSPRASGSDGAATLVAYVRGKERIAAFVAEAGARADKISGGGVDLSGGANWMLVLRERTPVCADDGCHEIAHDKYVLRDTARVRHIYRIYNVGSSLTTSKLELRMRRAWRYLSDGTSRARLIAIATEDPEGLPAAEVAMLHRTLTEPR